MIIVSSMVGVHKFTDKGSRRPIYSSLVPGSIRYSYEGAGGSDYAESSIEMEGTVWS